MQTEYHETVAVATNSPMLEHALSFAISNFYVFPVPPGTK
jgi:hypothetical protein